RQVSLRTRKSRTCSSPPHFSHWSLLLGSFAFLLDRHGSAGDLYLPDSDGSGVRRNGKINSPVPGAAAAGVDDNPARAAQRRPLAAGRGVYIDGSYSAAQTK